MPLTVKRYPKRSPYWYMRGTVQGVRVDKSTGQTRRSEAEAVAIKYEREIFERVVYGVKATATFAEAVNVYLDGGGDGRFLIGIVKEFGEMMLHEITQKQVDKLARKLHPGCEPSTWVRQIYTPILAVMNDAADAELCTKPNIKKPKVKVKPVKPATDDYLDKLLPACEPRLAAFVLFMTYSGARVSEVCRMLPEHFNLQEGWALLETTKNGESRMVPLAPRVIAAVANIIPERGPVFGWPTRHGVTSALKRAAKAANVAYMSPHKIGRHAFAARLLADGADIKLVKEAGGWKSIRIVDETYGHLEQRKVHDAMLKVAKR